MFEIVDYNEIDLKEIEDGECYLIDLENGTVADVFFIALCDIKEYVKDKECLMIKERRENKNE